MTYLRTRPISDGFFAQGRVKSEETAWDALFVVFHRISRLQETALFLCNIINKYAIKILKIILTFYKYDDIVKSWKLGCYC